MKVLNYYLTFIEDFWLEAAATKYTKIAGPTVTGVPLLPSTRASLQAVGKSSPSAIDAQIEPTTALDKDRLIGQLI